MPAHISIGFDALEVGVNEFWRLVRWCLAAGATDFTLSAVGYEQDDVAALMNQAKQTLAQFARPSAIRAVPVYCNIEQKNALLWRLDLNSINALETIGLDGLFVPAASATLRGESDSRKSTLHHLCLYREGEPILMITEEEAIFVDVFLRRDELESLRAQHFGVEIEFNELSESDTPD